jgi:hypothetical protein
MLTDTYTKHKHRHSATMHACTKPRAAHMTAHARGCACFRGRRMTVRRPPSSVSNVLSSRSVAALEASTSYTRQLSSRARLLLALSVEPPRSALLLGAGAAAREGLPPDALLPPTALPAAPTAEVAGPTARMAAAAPGAMPLAAATAAVPALPAAHVRFTPLLALPLLAPLAAAPPPRAAAEPRTLGLPPLAVPPQALEGGAPRAPRATPPAAIAAATACFGM